MSVKADVGPGSPIETAVIDLDDTLVLSTHAYKRALRTLRDFGVSPDAFVAAHRRWWRAYQAGQCTMQQLHARRMAECGLTGVVAIDARECFVRAAATVSWRLGAPELLRDLRDLGINTVVLTNGASHDQRGKVRWLQLDRLVDAVVISDEIGHAKPLATAFLSALSAVDGSSASATMIGDDLDVDVLGALCAGYAQAVWITRRPGSAPDRRIAKVRSLRHVLAALGLPAQHVR